MLSMRLNAGLGMCGGKVIYRNNNNIYQVYTWIKIDIVKKWPLSYSKRLKTWEQELKSSKLLRCVEIPVFSTSLEDKFLSILTAKF